MWGRMKEEGNDRGENLEYDKGTSRDVIKLCYMVRGATETNVA